MNNSRGLAELNELTKRLYAEGYTRDDYPKYAYWRDYHNFGFKWEHLLTLTWETPCGLLISGDTGAGRCLSIGDCYYNGVWYCAENDNPLITCPHRKKDCRYIPEGYPLAQCPAHMTDRTYDYELSYEKIEDSRDKAAAKQYMEMAGGSYCACLRRANEADGRYYEINYDADACCRFGCKNEVCVITKQARDLRKANVYYDVRKTWLTRKGIIEDKRIEVVKGNKVFESPVAWSSAEAWLRQKKAEYQPFKAGSSIFRVPVPSEERRMKYFSDHHRKWPDYDYFEFDYEVENIRIDSCVHRDLAEDIRMIAEGIEVTHASDLKAAAKQQKREAKEKRAEQKERAREKNKIAYFRDALADENTSEMRRRIAERELKKRGVDTESTFQQETLF